MLDAAKEYGQGIVGAKSDGIRNGGPLRRAAIPSGRGRHVQEGDKR